MTQTTNYNLNLVEGTDVVNPLVQFNPNFSDIDAAMFANKSAVIGTATELTAGTVHTITRNNTDSNYFKWTATSNWTAGDTMILDSTPVSVYLSDGTVPASGAYVINTEVLALVSGTRVTLLVSGSSVDAQNVSYDNTLSGLSATNAQSAIDEVQGEIGSTNISAIGDGTITGAVNAVNTSINAANTEINNAKQLFNGISESSNVNDMNDLPQGYFRYWHTATDPVNNSPLAVAGLVFCFAANFLRIQIAFSYTGANVYYRAKYGNTWTAWSNVVS